MQCDRPIAPVCYYPIQDIDKSALVDRLFAPGSDSEAAIYFIILVDGFFCIHFENFVSVDFITGSCFLKYCPWIPIRPPLRGYQSVPVSLS